MIIQIGTQSYPMVSIGDMESDLSFRQQMELQRELTLHNVSRCKTMQDILDLLDEIPSMTLTDLEQHPEGLFLLGLMVWASKVAAGEKLGFLDALDFDPRELAFIPEPGDEVPDAAAGKGDGVR